MIGQIELMQDFEVNGHITSKDIFPFDAPIVSATTTIEVKLSCKFDFSKYPFDRQSCPLEFFTEDFNVTVYENEYWLNNQPMFGGYDLEGGNFFKSTWSNFYRKNRIYFGVNTTMTRQIEAFFYQYYLPCIVVVTMSFSSFMIPLAAIPGRVVIIVTQFLTLTNIFIHQMVFIKTLFIKVLKIVPFKVD